MAAVTASTKSESPMIEWAGVETGAKILVGLREPPAGSARAVTGTQRRTRAGTANRARRLEKLVIRMALTYPQLRGSVSISPGGWQ